LSPLLYYRKYPAGEDLEDLVKYFWVMRSREQESSQDLLIPDGYPEIIFVLQGEYQKAYLDPEQPPVIIDASCLVGIQTQTVLANRLNHCHLIGIKLKPAGAYRLLGPLLSQISDTNRYLDSCGLPWLNSLNQYLKQTNTDTEVLSLIHDSLLRQKELTEVDVIASSLITPVLFMKGQISVKELALQHSLSVRHVQRKFKSYFGISPKKFISLIRFKHFYKNKVLKQQEHHHFLDYGYYDQMHFIRDFQKHLGITPSRSEETAFIRLNQMAQINS
ncbi:MAG: helix-turn-helix transcriptional regulator, partial [Bacteroidota bacterium]